jgi:hypothetical protein
MHGEGSPAVDPSRLARAVLAGSVGWCCMGLIMTFGHASTEQPP